MMDSDELNRELNDGLNGELNENLLSAWIGLNGLLKDSRMTDGLSYNEAIVMNLIYSDFRQDENSRTPVARLLADTRMLKSQMNRTVDALCKRGLVDKEREGRRLFVRISPAKLGEFLAVHARSLQMADRIIEIIGPADAQRFISICEKLKLANFTPLPQ